MTALDQWLSRRKDAMPAQEMWSLAFPEHRVVEVQRMPRQMRDDSGYVEKGYAVLLAGPGQQAGAWFPAFEPAAAWARSGRQSGSYSSLEMRQASRVTRNIDGMLSDNLADHVGVCGRHWG